MKPAPQPFTASLQRRLTAALALGGLALVCLSDCRYDVMLQREPLSADAGGIADGQGGHIGWMGGASASPGASGGPAGGASGGGGPLGRSPLSPAVHWQWQLTGAVDTTHAVQVYVIDLFDVNNEALRQLKIDDRIIICEFSAGTQEPWRSDLAGLPEEALGNPSAGDPSETWLDVQSSAVHELMITRMDRAVERGCDGVLPDSVDGYSADTGFSITREDSLAYLGFLASEAKRRKLLVGLSNCAEIAAEAEPLFDFAVQSACLQFGECLAYQSFLNASKPVLHTEFVSDSADGQARLQGICEAPARRGFSTILKLLTLDAWKLTCE